MKALVIGGTRFVGRHIVDALLAREHTVTLFNRGTNPSVHDGLEEIHGDRASDLHAVGERRWDAVIDTCGFTPDVVAVSAAYFADRTQHYVFVSTRSVYDAMRTEGRTKTLP